MATQTTVIRVPRQRSEPAPVPHRLSARPALLAAAPLAALLAGLAAEWLDFRALRYPLLLMAGIGVLLTAHALARRERGLRAFAIAVATGIATWAAAETLYVIIHTATGQPFEAERFGPQPAQAIGLIAAHGLFLGAPTGAVAGVMLQARALLRGRRG